jgi:hypothetical protein
MRIVTVCLGLFVCGVSENRDCFNVQDLKTAWHFSMKTVRSSEPLRTTNSVALRHSPQKLIPIKTSNITLYSIHDPQTVSESWATFR